MLANTDDAPEAVFFSLSRDAGGQVIAERGNHFTDLRHNTILDALGEIHDRELDALSPETLK